MYLHASVFLCFPQSWALSFSKITYERGDFGVSFRVASTWIGKEHLRPINLLDVSSANYADILHIHHPQETRLRKNLRMIWAAMLHPPRECHSR